MFYLYKSTWKVFGNQLIYSLTMNPISRFWRFYARHLNLLLLPFQAILDSGFTLDSVRAHQYRYHYLFPLSITTGILLDIAWNYNAYGPDPHKSGHFHHVIIIDILPDFFLEQAGTVYAGLYGITFFCSFFAYFDKFHHKDFILLLNPRTDLKAAKLYFPYRKLPVRFLDQPLVERLVSFHVGYRKQIKRFFTFLAIELDLGYTFPITIREGLKVYSTNGEYIPSFRTIVCWIACPLYFRSLVVAINVGIQFMCQNYVIQLKQRHYLSGLDVGQKIEEMTQNSKKFYTKWRKTLGQVLDLTIEIGFFNR